MEREQHTAAEIRAEVKKLFDPWGTMRKRVPQPFRVEHPEPGQPNWGMKLLRTPDRGIQAVFVAAVQDVRARWDLKD